MAVKAKARARGKPETLKPSARKGAAIRKRRVGLGLSLARVAKAARIGGPHLSRVERGLAGGSVEAFELASLFLSKMEAKRK